MKTKSAPTTDRNSLNTKLDIGKFIFSAVIYAAFAVYLYRPYFTYFNALDYLVLVNAIIASLGCFTLSRRWIASPLASLFAGSIYGFGPFALGFSRYHPSAGLLFAILPWLFCPAAFWLRGRKYWMALIRVLFCLLPFLFIVLFFWTAAHFRLFPIPTQARLSFAGLTSLLTPLTSQANNFAVSFYHIPMAALVMGLLMFFLARRVSVMIIFVAGAVLASCDSFLQTSPIIWAGVPVLCCSVLIGIGTQALAWATAPDRLWVLICAAFTVICAAVSWLLAIKIELAFIEAAGMYAVGALAVIIIFFMVRAKLRLRWLRWAILCAAIGLDIFIGAQTIVDRIF